mmetsp:Transcript_32785/g.51240  ORF Transcript_32785/g.51240 Transcript_32785/m.51240 type:complete len:111 (+) Transcript_32785:400-732(+)
MKAMIKMSTSGPARSASARASALLVLANGLSTASALEEMCARSMPSSSSNGSSTSSLMMGVCSKCCMCETSGWILMMGVSRGGIDFSSGIGKLRGAMLGGTIGRCSCTML